MNPHFFTAPFYFAFIWFRVQGSRFRVRGSRLRWRLRRLFLEDGILVSQPSPLGECYYVKRQNVLGSPSGELPEGLRGLHSGIA